MHPVFAYQEGTTPLLISVPHDGREIPDDIRDRMTPAGQDVPDTDWHVARLYDFAHALGASVLVAQYSRYVIDLNRSADDAVLYEGQVVTGLCPEKTFAGDDIYRNGRRLTDAEKSERVRTYWQPYHDMIRETLDTLVEAHGYALLWDAHSIPSEVPRLFEGQLPVLNVGTFDGKSCDQGLARKVFEIAHSSPYESVLNGRFKGGFITRNYGKPEKGVNAIQLEISQRAYMDEASRFYVEEKAADLRETLTAMLGSFISTTSDVRR